MLKDYKSCRIIACSLDYYNSALQLYESKDLHISILPDNMRICNVYISNIPVER